MAEIFIGVDLGGTKIASIAGDAAGKIVARDVRPTEAERGPDWSIGNIKKSIARLVSDVGGIQNVKGIGVGSPGPLNTSEGIVYSSPNLKWRNVPIRQIIQDEFDVRVELDNDANVAGLAEWRFGAGEQCRNMLYVTVSTGIGGGIIVEKQLYRGSRDFAGEIGHMVIVDDGPLCGCGRRGCLEALASGTAIGRRAREVAALGVKTAMIDLAGGKVEAIDSAIVAKADAQGDPYASEILDEAIRYLSIGLGSLVSILNPDRIVIGGGVSNIGQRLFEPLERMMRTRAVRESADHVKVVKAKLGGDAGAIGAMCLVL